MQITGPNGTVAEVTKDGYQRVLASSRRRIAQVAEEGGLAFAWASTFDTGGADITAWLLKNTLPGYDIYIDRITASGIAAAKVIVQKSTGTPGGATAAQGTNLRTGGPVDPQTAFYGAASVTGTTAAGIIANGRVGAAGFIVFDFDGALIIDPNTQVEVESSVDEVYDVTAWGWYQPKA